MGAKIFISWSGELSKALGEAIRDWIPKVLQCVKPYFTPDDIEKGSRWAKDISQELASSQLGIICLTSDNQNSPWILFEAGALSKNLEESKVCPILFNFDTTDLKGPLSSFQATSFNKADFKKLLESINSSCDESKLEQNNLDETFEMWWPKLDEKIKGVLAQYKTTAKPIKRSERDILEEILELTRSNTKSIYSDSRGVSRMTIEELVFNYRQLRDIIAQGNFIDLDFIRLDRTIKQLCREGNCEDLYYRKLGGARFFGSYGIADGHIEKNSIDDSIVRPLKRNTDDEQVSDVIKNK